MGLGTDSPTSFGPTFQVAGTDPALLLQDTATAVDYFGVNVTSGKTQLWYDDAAAFTINTATGISGTGLAERLRISSAGRVGIATDAPNTVLHIKSTQNSDGLTVAKESTVSAFLGHNGTGTEGLLTLKEGGTTRVQLYAETGQTSYINSGNLGIGTVTPEYKTTIAADGANAKLNIKRLNSCCIKWKCFW